MAAKLIKAKEVALQIDPEYYAQLWVNSHEACPNWMPPPDPAATDSYLGNGYFPTWCADVARRQLQAATKDPRYAFGETILTFWPWPTDNFGGTPSCTRRINVDDDGDGKTDRKILVPTPVFHFLGLLSSMGDEYWPLADQSFGGHGVTGFASRTERDLRILVYAYNPLDTQSRSDRTFTVSLNVTGVPWPNVHVEEYRFDRVHNTYYDLAQRLRDAPLGGTDAATTATAIDKATQALESKDPQARIAALNKLTALGPAAQSAVPVVFRLLGEAKEEAVRSAALAALTRIGPGGVCYSADEVRRVQTLSELRSTGSSTHSQTADDRLQLTANLEANGAAFLIVTEQR
jgi:hypothetical protein